MTQWSVFADGKPVYDPRITDRGYVIGKDAALAVELSKAGKFSFTLPQTNPAYSAIKTGSPIIELFRGRRRYFRGRVLSDEISTRNSLRVVCESELAYLNDSVQRPYSFPQEEGKTDVPDYVSFLISRHNPQVEPHQRFVVGRVTVKDPNGYLHRSDTEYSSTWKLIKDGLLDKLGGYLIVRRVDGVNYLDYLADIDFLSGQEITFGENFLEVHSERSKAGSFSAIIPLGAKDEETGERLTLAEIPDEETEDICKQGDALYSKAAVAAYGRIERVKIYDDITTTDALKRRAAKELGEGRAIPKTIKITAADMSGAGYDVDDFYVGYNVKVNLPYHKDAHGLEPSYLVRRMDLKLFDPASNVLTVGATTYGFLEQQSQQNTDTKDTIIDSIGGIIDDKVDGSAGTIIEDLQSYTDTAVQQSSSEIRAEARREFYTKDETAKLVGKEVTKITTTPDGIVIDFTQLRDKVNSNGTNIEEINSFIRLEPGGKIRLGLDNDSVEMVQQNNRLSFVDRGTKMELAYISDGKFFAPHISVAEMADMAGFRAVAENGLKIKWIGG